jgi:Tfp pilus assembly protein PilO
MKVTKRERQLLTITVTVIVLGINYVLVIPLRRSRSDVIDKLKTQRQQLTVMQETIKRKADWQKQYDELRQGLGQRTENFQQDSDVRKRVEEIGTSSGVQITSRRSMAEEDKGVYRVLPVQYALDANTDSLVRFLFSLQTGAGFMSVEQLQIAPKPENPTILRCDILLRALAAKQRSPNS